jgi:hypothetical protein
VPDSFSCPSEKPVKGIVQVVHARARVAQINSFFKPYDLAQAGEILPKRRQGNEIRVLAHQRERC